MAHCLRQDRYINLLRVAGLAYDHLRSKRDIFTVHMAERPAAEMADGTSSSRHADFQTRIAPPAPCLCRCLCCCAEPSCTCTALQLSSVVEVCSKWVSIPVVHQDERRVPCKHASSARNRAVPAVHMGANRSSSG